MEGYALALTIFPPRSTDSAISWPTPEEFLPKHQHTETPRSPLFPLPSPILSTAPSSTLSKKQIPSSRKTAHFSIKVSQEECQELLSKLPPASIEPDKDVMLSQLARHLKNEVEELTEEERNELAEKIYESNVLPLLAPRVEKFNELMNEAATKSLSTGIQFKLTGESHSSESKGFAYDATLEFEMKAEPSD